MSDVFEKCSPEVQYMVMRFKAAYKTNATVAEQIGVCTSTLDNIRQADDPSTIRIKRDTRQTIERRYKEVFGEVETVSKVRLSKHVVFPYLIRLLNDKDISTQRIASDIEISGNTIRNYKNGSEPKYETGAILIEYAAKHLSKEQLEKAGVILD